MKWLRRLAYWSAAGRRERELREEMETHRQMLREELEGEGLAAREAGEEARRRFGSGLVYGEESRGAWIGVWWSDLWLDLRYAARVMRRSPGVAVAAVLSSALGIGVCTAIFGVGSMLLETPLRVERAERLVGISGRSLRSGHIGSPGSWPERNALNESAQTMAGVAAYFPVVQGIFGGGEPVRYWGSIASANYFDVVRPAFVAGGGFDAGDDGAGRAPAVVISHRLWRTHFRGEAGLVGRAVEMNGRMVTLKGITGEGFRGTDPGTVSDFWMPFSMKKDLRMIPDSMLLEFDANWLLMVGRLRDGATLEGAQREFDVIAARLRQDHASMPRKAYHLEAAGRLHPALRSGVRTIYLLLLATSLLVLGITCANIANLLLARAAARGKEIATRLAIGAGRGRLIRQLLAESLLLAACGGALGAVLCVFGLPFLGRVELPAPLPVDLQAGMDGRVTVFACLMTVLTGIAFGLAPAWKASRQDFGRALKGGPGWRLGRRWSTGDLLVVGQVATAVLLLIVSGLLLRSLRTGAQLGDGVGAENLLLVSVDPALRQYSAEREKQFFDEMLRRIGELPGVESVSTTSRPPLSVLGVNMTGKDSRRKDAGGDVTFNIYSVSARFFETLRVPVVEGEEFSRRHEGGDAVAIVNEAAARKLFGRDNAVGLRIEGLDKPYRVIGVTAGCKSSTLGEEASPAGFVLRGQSASSPTMFGTYFVVRTAGEALGLLPEVRAEIRRMDAGMAILEAKTWGRHREQALLVPRVAAMVVTFCGGMGFLIAAIGLYGVVRYSVERRRREMGIRLALGARPGGVQGWVRRRGGVLTGGGVAIGAAAALGVGRG
ncbi:MAG: ABC transporter permease, partial [Bryobacterales bacterium]|nr:ABC transporter permease [Bryobacterales bacterium]